jgi:hypothetical protein
MLISNGTGHSFIVFYINTIKQFCIVNLTKTWLGNFLGDFSLSLGDFFTKTSGHPGPNSLKVYLHVRLILH